jgi:hypothetical protein
MTSRVRSRLPQTLLESGFSLLIFRLQGRSPLLMGVCDAGRAWRKAGGAGRAFQLNKNDNRESA